jgi:protein ImuA
MIATQPAPETIHPGLWLGSQLARGVGRSVDTGYAVLSAELPGGGWPIGALVELLVQQPGVGEIRLLQPALSAVSKRPVALIQPPHVPNALAFSYLGLPADTLMRISAPKAADALWSAEQILRTGSCGALLLWQTHSRPDALRRLLPDQNEKGLRLATRLPHSPTSEQSSESNGSRLSPND